MNYLSSFFIAFCVSSIFIGAVFILCPTGQMSKSVRFVFSLVFTLIIISSALKINFNFDFTPDTNGIGSNAEAIEKSSAVYVYSECLKQNKIDFSEISVLTTKTDDGRIVISKVLIFSKEEKNKILSALSVIAQNLEVEVINE